jgi:glycosyltransferase involved in cell wall biosynthesis
MEKCVFSVIIPHKNIPDLLQRCLDSIPKRDDIQIIVVDDNSDASQVDFNNFPGLNDKHVELYLTKEGIGAGYARNIGLLHAKGKWLLFADADDFFTENAFDLFFSKKDSPHDIIYFKVTGCYSDTYKPEKGKSIINQLLENCFYKKRNSENLLRYRHCVPWGKMIKLRLIKGGGIRFDEIIVHEDRMFSTLAAGLASSVDVVIHTPVYCKTIRRGSLEHTNSYEMLLTRYLVILRLNEFFRKNGKYKYQYRTMRHIYSVTKYGIIPFCYFIWLSIRYRNNIFFGICNFKWVLSYFKLRKYKKVNEKYFVDK